MMHFLVKELRKQIDKEGQQRLDEAIAADLAASKDEKRVKARQRLARTLPSGTLLPDRGSAATVLDLMKNAATAVFVPCGSLGIRLFFAESSEEDRLWHVPAAFLQRFSEEHFCLIASDGSGKRLDLCYRDDAARRMP